MSEDVASRQEDEISSLESIFIDDEIIRSEPHGTSAGQFCAYIEVPETFQVVYRLPEGSSAQRLETVPNIRYLPPIILHFSLPDDYPLNPKSPPSFTLTCQWLGRDKLSKLCRELDRLWEENKVDGDQGNEVLFIWAQFLKTESLSFLNMANDTLDISAIEKTYYARRACNNAQAAELSATPAQEISGYAGAGSPCRGLRNDRGSPAGRLKPAPPDLDCRAVLDLGLDSSLAQHLVEYDARKCADTFRRQHHTCNVCFLNKLGSSCSKFEPCGHVFCVECTAAYFSVAINDGKIRNIKCPESKCESEAQFNQIKALIPPELFARYDAMLLEATLDELGDIVLCPRPECQYSVTRDGDEKLANCFRCRYAFCVDCRMGYHGVEPCRFKSAEEQRLIEEYNEGTVEQRAALEKRYSKRRLETLVENSLTKAWISDNSKNCPHCCAAIQKTFGCNKMVCWKCGSHFCWVCSARLDPRFPYLHFTMSTSKCYQLLFQGIEADPDNPDDNPEMEEEEFYPGVGEEDEYELNEEELAYLVLP